MNEIKLHIVIIEIFLLIMFAIIFVLSVMTIEYVNDLYRELNFTNRENKNLLDKIDQGLLVFRNNDHWQ